MTTISQGIGLGTFPRPYPGRIRNNWHNLAFKRLTEVFESAQVVPFDDSSRFVFFSDIHRGDNGRADSFVSNKPLFLRALTHYYQQGFTYIEVGDGDDLWKHCRFSKIRQAHRSVFDQLHRFDRQGRLHLILGNHDVRGSRQRWVDKDGIAAHEGLILRHERSGQQIFVVHGHQADLMSDGLSAVSQIAVRYVWRTLQIFGLVGTASQENDTPKRGRIEQRIVDWVQAHKQVVVCGHTHHPTCTNHGAPPYFNTGSCIYPGFITGLEIQDGHIMLVKWTAWPGAQPNGTLQARRELIAPPVKLNLLT